MRFPALLLLAVASFVSAAADAAEKARLSVMATTDLHMYLQDYDYYADKPDNGVGLVRVAPLIAAERAATPNTLLLDDGDLIEGNPMGEYLARQAKLPAGTLHPAMALMNQLAYDAAVVGNHEFNYGLEFLRQTLAGAKFPYLAGNVDKLNQDGSVAGTLYPPYVILERTLTTESGKKLPIKIGVIGVLTPQIMMWDADKLKGKVDSRDLVEAAKQLVPEVRARGAQIVIALVHSGLGGGPAQSKEENAARWLAEIPGVDALISGHSHQVFPGTNDYKTLKGVDMARGLLNGVPTVMPGNHGSHLGVISLVLEGDGKDWKIVDRKAESRPVQAFKDGRMQATTEPDMALTAMLKPFHDQTLDYVRRPVGTSKKRVQTYLALVGDTVAVKLVADAQRWHVAQAIKNDPALSKLPILSAAAPFKAGGRPGVDYYTDFDAGPVAIRNVADLYLYPNTVSAVKMTGAEIREYLESASRIFNRIDPAKTDGQFLVNETVPSYVFDVIDGLTYSIDVTQPQKYDRFGKMIAPDARRIVDLKFQGKPIGEDQEFIVVTNNYRANGGGEFPGMDGSKTVYASPETTQQVLVDYLRLNSPLQPGPGSGWSFVPVTTKGRILLATSPKALGLLAGHKGLRPAGPGEKGFTLLSIDLREPRP